MPHTSLQSLGPLAYPHPTIFPAFNSVCTPKTINNPTPYLDPKTLPQTCLVSGCCSPHRIAPWAWMHGNGHGCLGMGMKNSWPALSSACLPALQLEAKGTNPKSGESRAALSQGTEPPHPLRFWELWGRSVFLGVSVLLLANPKALRKSTCPFCSISPKSWGTGEG